METVNGAVGRSVVGSVDDDEGWLQAGARRGLNGWILLSSTAQYLL